MDKANSALSLPKMETREPDLPTKMVAFRFDEETNAMLEANARAAGCTKTDMLKFLIHAYFDQHVSKIPRPLVRKRRPA